MAYPNILTPDAKMHASERGYRNTQSLRERAALSSFMRSNGKTERQGDSYASPQVHTKPVLRRWFV